MNEISLLFYFIPGVQIVGTVQRKAEEKKALGAGREGQAPTPPPHPPTTTTTFQTLRERRTDYASQCQGLTLSLEKQAGV